MYTRVWIQSSIRVGSARPKLLVPFRYLAGISCVKIFDILLGSAIFCVQCQYWVDFMIFFFDVLLNLASNFFYV